MTADHENYPRVKAEERRRVPLERRLDFEPVPPVKRLTERKDDR